MDFNQRNWKGHFAFDEKINDSMTKSLINNRKQSTFYEYFYCKIIYIQYTYAFILLNKNAL